jgi:hypothetical protein
MAAVGRLVGFNDAYRQVSIYTGRISQGGEASAGPAGHKGP